VQGKKAVLTRKTRLGLAIAAVAVLGIVGWCSMAPRHTISEANYSRIRLGMTEGEVEEILGTPAGDYTFGRASRMWHDPGENLPHDLRSATWRATDCKLCKQTDTAVFVYFDGDNRVVTCAGGSSTYDAPWLAWLKRKLGF
jgi:hypothetical protein